MSSTLDWVGGIMCCVASPKVAEQLFLICFTAPGCGLAPTLGDLRVLHTINARLRRLKRHPPRRRSVGSGTALPGLLLPDEAEVALLRSLTARWPALLDI